MLILGIETSCDETGIALYHTKIGVLENYTYTQDYHLNYGGVVPEIASRDHIKKIIPLIKKIFKNTNFSLKDLNGIAYTAGPGLIGSLMVGASVAKGLGFILNIPTLAINHMEGHLLSPLITSKNINIIPCIALLISGGHTQIINVSKIGSYKILGNTLDDAVGESFDKIANLLGFKYPGGKELEKLAKTGNSKRFIFPIPMMKKNDLNFSYSGLKTFTIKTWEKSEKNNQNKADIAAAFQDSVAKSLLIKSKKALQNTGYKKLLVSGGVSANKKIRKYLTNLEKELKCQVIYPSFQYCGDNAAMIAYAGSIRFKKGECDSSLEINIKPRWSLEDLKNLE